MTEGAGEGDGDGDGDGKGAAGDDGESDGVDRSSKVVGRCPGNERKIRPSLTLASRAASAVAAISAASGTAAARCVSEIACRFGRGRRG